MKKVRPKSKVSGENRRKTPKNSKLSPNWNQLKQDYFLNDHLTVLSFLEENGILKRGEKPSGTIARIVLGWKKAKLEYLERKYEEEAEARSEEYRLQSKFFYSTALQKKIRILNEIDKRIALASLRTEAGQFLVSTKDLCLMLERMKIELGESNIIPATKPNNNLDLNHLIEYINENDQPFDRNEYEKKRLQEAFTDAPDVYVDGKLMYPKPEWLN